MPSTTTTTTEAVLTEAQAPSTCRQALAALLRELAAGHGALSYVPDPLRHAITSAYHALGEP